MFAVKKPGNHTRALISNFAACAATALTIASFLAPLPASAAFGQKPPSTPGNFHVTGTTTSSVSFAWTASNAGSDSNFVYEIERNDGYILNFGKVTSGTWNVGLQAGATYSFFIFAIDTDNRVSADSPAVTVTLPAPPPPPPQVQPDAPVITQVSATSDAITVSWTETTPAADVGGYEILVNGTEDGGSDTSTEATAVNLSPDTAYTITIVAFSKNGTLQATSAPIDVTTATPPNTTPPTAPTDLTGGGDGCDEAIISWNPSTSVNEPQSQIYYEIYLNGVFDVYDSGVGQTTGVYIFPRGAIDPVQVYVVAVDQYGNASAPSNILTVEF